MRKSQQTSPAAALAEEFVRVVSRAAAVAAQRLNFVLLNEDVVHAMTPTLEHIILPINYSKYSPNSHELLRKTSNVVQAATPSHHESPQSRFQGG